VELQGVPESLRFRDRLLLPAVLTPKGIVAGREVPDNIDMWSCREFPNRGVYPDDAGLSG